MSMITASMARQSAIINANQAQLSIIKANQAQQDLINAPYGKNLSAVAKKEAQIEAQKEMAKTKAQVANAQKKALNKRKRLDVMA